MSTRIDAEKRKQKLSAELLHIKNVLRKYGPRCQFSVDDTLVGQIEIALLGAYVYQNQAVQVISRQRSKALKAQLKSAVAHYETIEKAVKKVAHMELPEQFSLGNADAFIKACGRARKNIEARLKDKDKTPVGNPKTPDKRAYIQIFDVLKLAASEDTALKTVAPSLLCELFHSELQGTARDKKYEVIRQTLRNVR